jgi:hypothetical protein
VSTRRIALAALALALGGCASKAVQREDSEATTTALKGPADAAVIDETRAESKNDRQSSAFGKTLTGVTKPAPAPSTEPPASPERRPAEKPAPPPMPAQPLEEDPHQKRPRGIEPAPGTTAGSGPRVRLPSPEAPVDAHVELPERFLVALAIVRDAKLAREEPTFRRLAVALEEEPCVKSVVSAPTPEGDEIGVDDLARAAGKEGARVLLVDARPTGREETERELLVVEAPSGRVLALRRLPAREGAVVGGDPVSRIVARVEAADR